MLPEKGSVVPIKILHIITGLATGGAEGMLYRLLAATDRARFDPAVISLLDRGRLGAKIEALGIAVGCLGMRRSLPTPNVAAARRLKRRHPSAIFRLVGPLDPNPAAIRAEELERWQAEGVIDYAGEVTDVRPALRDCSVYVLPSYREGMPRTVLEAMAIGRPIITTDVPGCRETVRDGYNGFLVPAQSVEPLADAMERFVREPALIGQMGQRSRNIAAERFEVRRVNNVMLRTMGLVPPGMTAADVQRLT